jgi:hypothetical protein
MLLASVPVGIFLQANRCLSPFRESPFWENIRLDFVSDFRHQQTRRSGPMRYAILFAAIAGVLGLSACEKTTVTPVPVPVPQSTPGPQGAPGPQGSAGEPGKSSTIVITPPASSSTTTSSTTTTESKSTDTEKK